MKKKHRNSELVKTIREIVIGLLIFALIQGIIVWKVILDTYIGRELATSENVQTLTFWADDVRYSKFSGVHICYDGQEYYYDMSAQSRHDPPVKLRQGVGGSLDQAIRKEELTMVYKEQAYIKLPWQKPSYEVVELRNDSMVFFTMEDFNEEQIWQRRAGTVGIIVAETLYLIAFGIFMRFTVIFEIEMHILNRPKRKKKKPVSQKRQTKKDEP